MTRLERRHLERTALPSAHAGHHKGFLLTLSCSDSEMQERLRRCYPRLSHLMLYAVIVC
ncbi:hypothetical protein CC77DRAFT_1017864 [Alternaria alternata]|uniref:Uncharacterized protein n=1 Tax=Alternaria alternata TaxID=5599 RepID=A0A177DTF7_ALTAL|nr:hypothetical protein CC77DRAFT_1017864 [Alternaria alternata]OAG23033.1 hypothetical protein CC77DRAFT_1017864 [Alternaria alternata]